MIQLYTIRVGVRVLAIHVNDFGTLTRAYGLTKGHAQDRVIKKIARKDVH